MEGAAEGADDDSMMCLLMRALDRHGGVCRGVMADEPVGRFASNAHAHP